MRDLINLVESANEYNGGWILPSGEFIPLNRGQGINHIDIVRNHFEEPDDPSLTISDAALHAGWIRVFPWRGELSLQWQNPVAPMAKRTIKNWWRDYSTSSYAFSLDIYNGVEYECKYFDGPDAHQQAQRFLMRALK